jgi:hypothetical protein
MATKQHQFILGLVIRKMKQEGFSIFNVDGYCAGSFGSKLPIPKTITRHRPDALGIRDDGTICIGEAKTEHDVSNKRTYEQLQDFVEVQLNGHPCEIFLGIPKSRSEQFRKMLRKLSLHSKDQLHVLYIPNELIDD